MNDSAQTPTFLQRVRRRVLVPLTLAWAISSALVVAVSYASTAQAFDLALLDQSHSVAGRLTIQDDGVIPAPANDLNTGRPTGLYAYAVYQGHRLVAGDGGLPLQPLIEPAHRAFRNDTLRGISVRCVTLRHPQARDITIVAAQDLREREEWLKRLVAYSIVPQVVLLLVLGWWLRHSLADEVAPLTALQRELDQRGSADLQPLSPMARPSFELSMLAVAINDLLARIDRGVQAQREFAGNVAHEIRTPLARVRGVAEHALARGEPQRWREPLEQVVQGCDQAARVVEQLLGLAMAAEARDTLQMEPLRLDDVVRATVLQRLPQADAQGVDLGADGLDEPVTVLGQRHLIEGLLGNLIDNALRYGRPVSPDEPAIITVALVRRPGAVQLCVRDNGPGIAPHEAQRLLGRWERGDTGTRRSGTGLGLAIVSRYCELMDTQLTLHAALHGGLEACVQLRTVESEGA